MAFSESLALRIRQVVLNQRGLTEKRMFGSVAFLLYGNVCVGVWKNSLIVRLDPESYGKALTDEHVQEFDITGRPMKGWVLVQPDGIESDEQLNGWIDRSLAFVRTLPPKDNT